MQKIKVQCPHCGVQVDVPMMLSGSNIVCPACKTEYVAVPVNNNTSEPSDKNSMFKAVLGGTVPAAIAYYLGFIMLLLPIITISVAVMAESVWLVIPGFLIAVVLLLFDIFAIIYSAKKHSRSGIIHSALATGASALYVLAILIAFVVMLV